MHNMGITRAAAAAATLVIIISVVVIGSTAPPFALALTGGRMGGSRSSSSSSSRSSYRSSSSSYRSYYRSPPSYQSCYQPPSSSSKWEIEVDLNTCLFILIKIGVLIIIIEMAMVMCNSQSCYTVFQLQVATLVGRKYLQKELNTIAGTADTSTSSGWAYILQETAKTLCGKLDECISAYSYVKKENVERLAMHLHASIARQECAKFDEETLVNTDGKEINLRRWFKSTAAEEEISGEYVVVTFVLVARGVHKFPAIISREDLKKALKMLMSIPATKIQALEVLWAPQQHDDVLTEEELHEKYPALISL